MADASGILTALLASGLLAHPQGHNIAGQEQGVPVHVDYGNYGETWNAPDDRKDTTISAGGYRGQDLFARLAQGSGKEDNIRYANALYKLLYPYTTKAINGSKGDIEDMERSSGNKNVGNLVALSALLDIMQAQKPDRTWSIDFEAPEGAPGLMFRKKF